MAITLDADVVIRGEKGSFDLKAWLQSRPNDTFEVAATALERGSEVATFNKRHFDLVPLPWVCCSGSPF